VEGVERAQEEGLGTNRAIKATKGGGQGYKARIILKLSWRIIMMEKGSYMSRAIKAEK